MDIGVEHHLVDVTGRQRLFVDNRAEIEALRHRNVVEILDHRHRLAHAEPFRRQTGENVGFGVARERHESLRVLDSLLVEQLQVATVAVNHHHAVGFEQFVESFAASLVGLDDFHLHIFGHQCRRPDRRRSTAHNDDIFHVGIAFFSNDAADVGNVLPRGHEIGDVLQFQHVFASRNNRFVASLDRHDVIGRLRFAEVFERLVEDFRRLAQLDAEHRECAVVNIPTLPHPRHFQAVGNIDGGEFFGINQRSDADALEIFLDFRVEILVVVDFCDGSLRSESLRQNAGRHIEVFVGCDGDEQVCVAYACLLERFCTRGRGENGHQIVVVADVRQPLQVRVDEHRVVVVARQEFREMGSDGVCADNNDFHKSNEELRMKSEEYL